MPSQHFLGVRRVASSVRLGLLIGLGLTIVSCTLFFAWSPGVYLGDDAFISLTYARNLVDGHGLVFNPGERVWGYTSPLQTLLLSAMVASGLDAMRAPAALAQLELGLAVFLLVVLLRRRLGLLAPLVALALFLHVRLHLFPGLESSLLVCLQVLFLFAWRRGRHDLAAFTAALACLARPDALVLVAPFFFSRGLRTVRHWLLFGLPGILWLTFSYVYNGQLLPNTLGAKTGSTPLWTYLSEAWIWLTARPFAMGNHHDLALRLVLVACSLSLLWLRPWRRERGLAYAFVVYPWLLILAYALIGAPIRQKWEIYSASFFFSAGWLLGAAGLACAIWSRVRRELLCLRLPVCAAATVLFCMLLTWGSTQYWTTVVRMQDNRVVGSRFQTYRTIAQWAEGNLREKASLGHHEVGTLGYFTERIKIVDTAGLVSRRFTAGLTGGALIRHMIDAHQPTHLLKRGHGEKAFCLKQASFRSLHEFPTQGYTTFTLFERALPDEPDPCKKGTSIKGKTGQPPATPTKAPKTLDRSEIEKQKRP